MTNPKILISDDSMFMRKILKDILATAGYTNIIEATNGKEAVAQYEAEKPDLVLLDLIMPEMDGFEVLKKIGTTAKVLVISAIGQESMIAEANQYGALGFVNKPFDPSQVLSEVKKALG